MIRLLGGPGHGQEIEYGGPPPVLHTMSHDSTVGSTVYHRRKLRFPFVREGWTRLEPSPDDALQHSSTRLDWSEREFWCTPGYEDLVDSQVNEVNRTALAWGTDAWLRFKHGTLPAEAITEIEAALLELDRVLAGEEI